jgi:uncharacterized membrane protein YvbJ
MKKCQYCGYSNYDYARACRKCDNSFLGEPGTVYQGRPQWIGSRRAKVIRSQALSWSSWGCSSKFIGEAMGLGRRLISPPW